MNDTEDTRHCILDAAIDIFSEHGPAGARVEAIATKAGCNKQLIYHYFGSKAALFEATILHVLVSKPPPVLDPNVPLENFINRVLDDVSSRRRWMRLMLWESLQGDDIPIAAEEQRRAKFGQRARDIEAAQRLGLVPDDLSPRHVMLAMMSLFSMPWMVPQHARLVTGQSPNDPAFRAAWVEVIARFVRGLATGCNHPDAPEPGAGKDADDD